MLFSLSQPLLTRTLVIAAAAFLLPLSAAASEKFFKVRDQNGDGILTLQEYTNKPVEESPGRTKIFKRIDANADGKLTLEELKQAASRFVKE